MNLAQTLASLYSSGAFPRWVSYRCFWRTAPYVNYYRRATLDRDVHIGPKTMRLSLPLKFQQNCTLLFEDFKNQTDGLALKLFAERAITAHSIYDIGANAGLYFYHALAHRPEGAMSYAFEPNDELADLMRTNLETNLIGNAEVHTACLSSNTGTATLFLTDTDHMYSLKKDFLKACGRPVLSERKVSTYRLDDFVLRGAVPPDLMKIDVEGAEHDVLAGASGTIEKHRPTLFIEFTATNSDATSFAWLQSLGYRCMYLLEKPVLVGSGREFIKGRQPGFENYLFSADQDL